MMLKPLQSLLLHAHCAPCMHAVIGVDKLRLSGLHQCCLQHLKG